MNRIAGTDAKEMGEQDHDSDTKTVTYNDHKVPDSDTIKMFVGQIPKLWDEDKLKEYFEEFGPIYQLSVLREKDTALSRGCCFITFYHRKDAINAQNALHNIRTFPGLSHPIQMKPADLENKHERKLFVGMLAKSMGECEVRELFKEFGQIEDCTILRENGKSKGCAFLTFVSRSCAHQAVRKMNHSQIFEGCSKPVVVKFADAGKEKTGKKAIEMTKFEEPKQQNGGTPQQNANATQMGIETLSNLVTLLQQPNIIPLLETARALQQLQTAQSTPTSMQQHQSHSDGLTVTSTQQIPALASLPQQHTSSTLLQSNFQQTIQPGLFGLPQGLLLQQPMFGTSSLAGISLTPLLNNSSTALSLGMPSAPGLPYQHQQLSPHQNQHHPPLFHSPRQSNNNLSSSMGSEKYHRGPDGCNLFIYHLPQDFVDSDLYSLFSHFGPILSAKVFIDKQTNLSKCFGFVSYADDASAQGAISGMNGFQIGNKRLKVQLKRSDTKPYEKPTV